MCLKMRYFNLKNTEFAKHWGLCPQTPNCLRQMPAGDLAPKLAYFGLDLRTSCFFPLWIHKIPCTPACNYTCTSVPVQTFYSSILIRVNKNVLPLHNLPSPQKNFFRLAKCLLIIPIFLCIWRSFFWLRSRV